MESECSETQFSHQCRNSGFISSGPVTLVMEVSTLKFGEGADVGNVFVDFGQWNGAKGQIRIQCMM